MNNSGQNLLTDFDEGIEEKRRLIEERKCRIKQRRQRAIELVNESYIHYGDNPGSVLSHKEQLRTPGVRPFVYNHEQPSLSKALPIQLEGSVERFGLSVGAKKTTDNHRKVAIENVLATEYRPHTSDDRQGSEQIGIPHQDVTFTSERPGVSSNHCDNDNCDCREITPSPYTTYLIMVRDFLKARHDEMTARNKPLPVRERALYDPSFLTIEQTPQDTSSRIQYLNLSPLDSPFVVKPELPRIHRQYSGLEMTSSGHLDLPGTPMNDIISLDGYGSRMSSTSISIDLPFASPTELHKWKAPRIATPYNFKESAPSPSSSSSASEDTEKTSTTSLQPNKFMKLYRRVKRSVHNMRHSLHNLLCGTTVQSLQ